MILHAKVDTIGGLITDGVMSVDMSLRDSGGLINQSATLTISATDADFNAGIRAQLVALMTTQGIDIASADVVLWGGPQ